MIDNEHPQDKGYPIKMWKMESLSFLISTFPLPWRIQARPHYCDTTLFIIYFHGRLVIPEMRSELLPNNGVICISVGRHSQFTSANNPSRNRYMFRRCSSADTFPFSRYSRNFRFHATLATLNLLKCSQTNGHNFKIAQQSHVKPCQIGENKLN